MKVKRSKSLNIQSFRVESMSEATLEYKRNYINCLTHSHTLKIAFIIPNFLPFGGNSRTVMTYIENFADSADSILLIESYGISETDDQSVNKLKTIKNLRIMQSRVKWYKLVDFSRSVKHGEFLHYLFYPFLSSLKRLLNGKVRREVKDFDAIYLFDITDAPIFSKGSKNTILGTHNQRMSRIKAILIDKGFFLPSIFAFRLFPNESSFAEIIKTKKVFVIPKGTDTNLFFPKKLNRGNMIKFLYVARLEPKKGFETLLGAWKQLDKRNDCELHIAGSGSLSSLITENDFANLKYHGELRRSDLADLYSNSDYFVFPTDWDAQPSVIIEAVSSGLVCLVSESMKGSLDDLENECFVQYIKNDVNSFIMALENAVKKGPPTWEIKQQMHAYIQAHRSLEIEVAGLKEAFTYASARRH